MSVKYIIGTNILNILGWKTNRRLIVIESDDWGSIRTPSKEAYIKLVEKSLIHHNYDFAKYDALASETDLFNLFDLLTSFQDDNGNHPVFTANCIMANPDFKKIKDSGFEFYHYELFTETFKRYPKHIRCFEIWKEGINNQLFYPQFHGREHINVKRWMNLLKANDINFRNAFHLETYAIKPKSIYQKKQNIAAALDFDDNSDMNEQVNILRDGLTIFSKMFNYNSESFIAPNYIWDSSIESSLDEMGVKYIQSSRFQNNPKLNSENYNRKFHYTGQKNKNNLTFLVRNCYFEPSLSPNFDVVNSCLKSISNAFFWKKPAIISTHRLNYVGYINSKNTDKNLPLLKQLLTEILKCWPDVEFITSPQLGAIITNEK